MISTTPSASSRGIYVQYLSMSNVDQKTLVATTALPPDVAGLWKLQVAQFAKINALEPLDDLARDHGITAAYYKPVLWEGCRYKGHLWALVERAAPRRCPITSSSSPGRRRRSGPPVWIQIALPAHSASWIVTPPC